MSSNSSKQDSVALYKIKKTLSELSNLTGRGTELVTLYVPPKKPIHEVIGALREEYGTASNIKSDTTRTHVQDALTKTMQRLKLFKTTPENGLVFFCGAIPGPGGPGNEIIQLYEIIPPKPVTTYLYRCDDHFHLDALRDMLKEEQKIGILALDATEAGLGIVSGDDWKVVADFTSGVSGKTRAGGQSARRYERLREMELTDYFNRLAKHCTEIFLDGNNVKGLIVGGPGPTKDDFLKQEYLDYRLQKGVVGVIDTGYSGSEGVREVIEKSGKLLENVRVVAEKRMVQNFLKEVNSPSGLAIYGINDIIENLKRGAADTIIIVDDNGMTYLRATCGKCGDIRERIVSRSDLIDTKRNLISTPCSNCGSSEVDIFERDLIEHLADLSIESGARVEVISGRTEEGMMLKNFGGAGAFLRYRTQ